MKPAGGICGFNTHKRCIWAEKVIYSFIIIIISVFSPTHRWCDHLVPLHPQPQRVGSGLGSSAVPANHDAPYNPFWCAVWKYYFGLSPSLCLRRVLVVLINTVTTITIGILQKKRSFPLCFNPICGLFVCLIKASKMARPTSLFL